MAAEPSAVLSLDAARLAREEEARLREGLRSFVVAVCTVTAVPPGHDPDLAPAAEILNATDLVSDPGRLGEIARDMLARCGSPPPTTRCGPR